MHSTRGRAHLLWEMLRGRRGHRRVALDRSARRARPLPVVQGMPVGLSGQRRHGDVQGRVHPPPLRGAGHGRGRCRTGRWVGCRIWSRFASKTPRLVNRHARGTPLTKRLGGIAPERDVPGVRRSRPSRRGSRAAPAPHADGAASGGAVAGHVHQLPCAGGGPRRGARCWRRPGTEVVLPDRIGVLRADLDLHRASCGPAEARIRRSLVGAGAAAGRGHARSWVWSRAARQCCDGTQSSYCPTTPRTAALAVVDADLRRVPAPDRSGSHRSRANGGLGADALPPARRTRFRRRSRADGKRLAFTRTIPDSGCCGLAGNFGFERGHYEVSRAVGERVLLPAVREAAPDHRGRRRRFQLPDPDRTRHLSAGRCTSPNCSPTPLAQANRRSAVSA